MQQPKFTLVEYPEPHNLRTRQILAAHPEVRKLFGNLPSTSIFVYGIVALQLAIAIGMSHSPWWMIVAVAWLVGAVADHALWVLIHECTHNLVFKAAMPNKLLQILANLPIFFPSAMSFRTFHLKHHRHQGETDMDADLAIDVEAKLAGRNPLGKALWLLTFFAFQPLRVRRLNIELFDRWIVINWVAQIAFLTATAYFFGWGAFGYFFFSGVFAVGLHPVGARWIQEHYVVKAGQETYSYYGPLNTVAFNVGYHNEHHDLMMVPWARLPKVRAAAPEIYEQLYYHRSWTGLLMRFLFDSELTLSSRIIRKGRAAAPRTESVPILDAISVNI